MPGIKRRRTITRLHQPGAIHTRWPSGRPRQGKSKAKNRIINVPRNKLAFPTNIRTTLRYTELQPFDNLSSSTGTERVVFNANNLRDPNDTTTGHQPRGFDEYMALYDAYTVHGASFSYHFTYMYTSQAMLLGTAPNDIVNTFGTPAAGGQVVACPAICVGVHKGIEELAPGSIQEALETDKVKWTMLSNGGQTKILKTKMNVGDYHGTTGSLTGREGYFGGILAGTDPTSTVKFTLFAQQLGKLPVPTPERCRIAGFVTIEYDVTFSEPKQLGAS